MTHYFSSDFKLGILGGGQLGKMMLYDTRKFDIQTYVMDPNPEAPSKIACNHFETGDLMDYDRVMEFGKQVDVLTFEIESVNVKALEDLEASGLKVYPSAATLKKIQNKSVQKEFYKANQIPTADFMTYPSLDALKKDVSEGKVNFPFVWKSSTGGYDGKGVSVIKSKKNLEALPNGECLAEELVDFKTEIAVIVARNVSGNIKTYPVVEMEFHPEANQVEYVLCPARIEPSIAEKARNLAQMVSNSFEHVGLLAIEMFLTQDDDIIVNEVAPRPHNSGHFSIEGSYTNQFEQHLRAILDLPLGETSSKTNSVMVNLVGDENHTGDVVYQGIQTIMDMPGVTPHIYGKKQTRPFRKMGHVNIIHTDIKEARKIAEHVKSTIKVISKH
ncbi:phosphoribosylaminoimidazole carboxylase ATPase subunit [Psychroflexus gondwanensis ACAM 44]|jgi:5-(carboxyamino)imidazole ribonucleotide synthase|uniref:N5-carboxyaminoimidazole ribonucleotide synthase n=1 Tax=Psychroflexus gondwanensis ACAM 44 TaxID=1189619 RepID=N1WWS7_9FLAO|nr:5-(carboxyamino)imidazole ribonucleotide synthase [Psychroflexus gondwanensis]EMY81647.1 phosphoribosylaminoimidazole carboxylase ATPase subunit [Psychroflexus gondwanensis ACAM 44]